MATDFQKYQAGRSLLSELDELLQVDQKGHSQILEGASIVEAKIVLELALEELLKRAEEKKAQR